MSIYTVPYFYIIKHTPSGKMYAGSRWKHGCHPNELLQPNGYYTSSSFVHELIERDGIDSFCVMYIHECDNPREHETSFLMENNCASSDLWLNCHNNHIYSHDSDEFRSIMVKRYGVEFWTQTTQGRKMMSELTSARNMLPENMQRWLDMNYNNNPSKKPKNRTAKSQHMRSLNASMTKLGTHPSKKDHNRKIASERMKVTRSLMPEITCPHCGVQSRAHSNMYRWHFDNCKSIAKNHISHTLQSTTEQEMI